jgi:hypothetical protein
MVTVRGGGREGGQLPLVFRTTSGIRMDRTGLSKMGL